MGTLFLLAFVVYAGGGALVGAGSTGGDVLAGVADDPARLAVGALLMLVNSAVVAGIGVLALPVLRPHGEISAHAYLIGRVVEAALLAVGVVFLLLLVPLAREHAGADADAGSALAAVARVAVAGNHYSYQVAMMSVGVVGVVFCRVLFRARLVPRFMAAWGLVGYAVFLLGAVLEVLGYGVGVALSVPGGLFEIALGVLLIAKGFPVAGNGVGSSPANGVGSSAESGAGNGGGSGGGRRVGFLDSTEGR
ncbi:DUF4386 domain-containing protein [Saccharothrix isguenensis]